MLLISPPNKDVWACVSVDRLLNGRDGLDGVGLNDALDGVGLNDALDGVSSIV